MTPCAARTLDDLRKLRESVASQGITSLKGGLPGYYESDRGERRNSAAIKHIQMLPEGLAVAP